MFIYVVYCLAVLGLLPIGLAIAAIIWNYLDTKKIKRSDEFRRQYDMCKNADEVMFAAYVKDTKTVLDSIMKKQNILAGKLQVLGSKVNLIEYNSKVSGESTDK